MKPISLQAIILMFLGSLISAAWAVAVDGQEGETFASLRERFTSPPAGAGTVTLYWLNGNITKEGIREQLRAMRDRCGFGGVASLTFHAMHSPAQPAYLSEAYFAVYGCILDAAKELGLTVVFYDDCDFPSGSAGNQMRQRYPESRGKLERHKRTCPAILPHPSSETPRKSGNRAGRPSGTYGTRRRAKGGKQDRRELLPMDATSPRFGKARPNPRQAA